MVIDMSYTSPGTPTAATGTFPNAPLAVASGGTAPPPCTGHPGLQVTTLFAVSGANQNDFYRSMGVGLISGIALWVGASSGNIAVGIYQSPGGNAIQSGQNLVRIASSGLIPCPAPGSVNIPISPAPVPVNYNSYFAIFADNTTATFLCSGSGWGTTNAYGSLTSGLVFIDVTSASAMPLNPNIGFGGRGVLILMTGI